jgi:tetratricopeptide (TPR) repeat protein
MRVSMGAAVIAIMVLGTAARAEPTDDRALCAPSGVAAERAIAACTALIASGRESPKNLAIAFHNRGNAYLTRNDFDHAIEDYSEAIRRDANYASAYHGRGLARQNKGALDLALQDFDQTIKLRPDSAVAYTSRGTTYRMKGRVDRAIEDFDQAIRRDAKHVPARFGRALAWQEKAEWDFDAYVNAGRYEDLAIQDYDEVIRLAPNTRAAFNNRGNVYVSKRQFERALADFEQAIRLAPDDAMYYRNRGNVFRLTGQYDRAIADYRKALSLKADGPTRKFVETALKELGVAS